MKTYLECIPCFAQQALGAVKLATDDTRVQEKVLRDMLKTISRIDMEQSPPLMGRQIHRHIREMLGQEDPYKKIKDQYNRLALDLFPMLAERVNLADNPLETAVRLAIAGNIIDFGANLDIDPELVNETIELSLTDPLMGDLTEFARAVEDADNILYLADNAGEIVFDRLLLERLPRERLTVAVRGAPVINDATRHDAMMAGITDLVPVIDNGTDIPGTCLQECSAVFIAAFEQADLIIAKGQGNYETLSEQHHQGDIFFLFKIKCAVAARDMGAAVGRFVARKKDLSYVG
ncbi:MAG: damage-control phosphatase ARMT1 family protein [Desulfosudaceae bacterium]